MCAEEQDSANRERLKTGLLKIVDRVGSVSVDAISEKFKIDKKIVIELAEELKGEGKLDMESKFMKSPTLISTKAKAEKKPESKEKSAAEPSPGKAKETPKPEEEVPEGEKIESYTVGIGEMQLPVNIVDTGDYVMHYHIGLPHIDFVTRALLDETKRGLVGEIQIETHDILDAEKFARLKEKFISRAKERLKHVLKKSSEEQIATLSRVVVNEMVGLGDLEYLLSDDHLEEVVVNNSRDVVWVYHKKHGWVKTNVIIPSEDMIINYSSRIAREVGREITHMEPLLDAHLVTGDRVNATLFPISTIGNTITIRRFSRTPWTIVHLIDPQFKTMNTEVASFLWMAMEHELSMLVAGGTASGKTTVLNALMPFLPANQRVITIEDTRELNLPEYLHWVPLTVRPANPQGEGEVSMLDLMQNSLRMRPDRVIVGEVRRKPETEVLFEAMHTGHSVYGTFHAEVASEVIDRITSPPMSIPGTVMKSLHLVVVQYRNRRTGQRRTFEIAEILKDENEKPTINMLYKWNPKTDNVEPLYPSARVQNELELFTGMSDNEIKEDMAGKQKVLQWMLDQNVRSVGEVGKIITEYYLDRDSVLELVEKKQSK